MLQGYAEKVKAKVIREYVGGNRDRKRWGKDKEGGAVGAVGGAAAGRPRSRGDGWRPPTRALPVRKQGRRLLKTRSQVGRQDKMCHCIFYQNCHVTFQSLSMDKLSEEAKADKASRLVKSKHTYYRSVMSLLSRPTM